MNRTIARDAVEIRNEIRKAEAAADEMLDQLMKLTQRIIKARQNPDLRANMCQPAIERLVDAQKKIVDGANDVFSAHAQLSRDGRELGIADEKGTTVPGVAEPTGFLIHDVVEHESHA